MKRFDSTVLFTLTVVSPLVAQRTEKPVLALSCTAGKASYTRDDTVILTVTLENRGSSKLYVYGTVEWGWAGLRFRFTDSDGHELPAQWLGIPPPTPPVYDKSQLVGLDPGYFFGTHIGFPLSQYKLKPGTYYLQVAYQSPYHKGDGFGLPILTFDDGNSLSNKVEVRIEPK